MNDIKFRVISARGLLLFLLLKYKYEIQIFIRFKIYSISINFMYIFNVVGVFNLFSYNRDIMIFTVIKKIL